jgi:hypothetical protein
VPRHLWELLASRRRPPIDTEADTRESANNGPVKTQN